jgi:RHS repeat-associated protein
LLAKSQYHVSKQTTTSHKGHQAVNRLTQSCHRRWKKHRTKYTYDHLGSVRELADTAGNLRARYSYDPYGRRTRTAGDLDSDFGFAGMFWSAEAALWLTRFRAYDPALGRWLSRDPLNLAEIQEGANLYTYVKDNPVNLSDPLGLKPCCSLAHLKSLKGLVEEHKKHLEATCFQRRVYGLVDSVSFYVTTEFDIWDPFTALNNCLSKLPDYIIQRQENEVQFCAALKAIIIPALEAYIDCLEHPCNKCKGKCASKN